jgi:hypothetical protein
MMIKLIITELNNSQHNLFQTSNKLNQITLGYTTEIVEKPYLQIRILEDFDFWFRKRYSYE